MSFYTYYVSKIAKGELAMKEDRLEDEDDETFMRRIIFAEEDRHLFTAAPWHGGFRWFRSPNVVPIEQRRKKKNCPPTVGDFRDPAA
jgi:hypothetical protein